jgi:hypothetical protein
VAKTALQEKVLTNVEIELRKVDKAITQEPTLSEAKRKDLSRKLEISRKYIRDARIKKR